MINVLINNDYLCCISCRYKTEHIKNRQTVNVRLLCVRYSISPVRSQSSEVNPAVSLTGT